jgi:hypothetical protein
MAAKKKSAKALAHPSTLKSLCEPVTCTFGALGSVTLSAGSWGDTTTSSGVPFLFWEGAIDLSAFSMKDLTWITTAKDIQEPGNFVLNYATPQRMEFIEFVSNTPFNLTRLVAIADNWEIGNAVPGMMNSEVDFQNIIDGRWRQFSPDTTLPAASALTLKSSSFGSCEPSASDRLYTYCMVKFHDISTIAPADTVFIPGRRFLLGGAAIQEGDAEYIMRLRRSYVLQQD